MAHGLPSVLVAGFGGLVHATQALDPRVARRIAGLTYRELNKWSRVGAVLYVFEGEWRRLPTVDGGHIWEPSIIGHLVPNPNPKALPLPEGLHLLEKVFDF